MARTVTAMTNELVKEFSIMWNYRTNTLLEIVLYYAIFFAVGFFMTGGQLDEQVIISSMDRLLSLVFCGQGHIGGCQQHKRRSFDGNT